ncbi:MAG: transglutaminase domain-containing protein [Planctomycetota bacterium]
MNRQTTTPVSSRARAIHFQGFNRAVFIVLMTTLVWLVLGALAANAQPASPLQAAQQQQQQLQLQQLQQQQQLQQAMQNPQSAPGTLTINQQMPSNDPGISLGNPLSYKWRVGVQIQTGDRPCKNLRLTIPVPVDWPEQVVEIDEESIPVQFTDLDYRDGESGIRQIVAGIRHIDANTEVTMTVTYNVQVSPINGPTDTSIYSIPEEVPRELRQYLGTSPGITFRNSKMRRQVREIVAEHEMAWNQVEGIYDWIRDNVEYRQITMSDSLSVFRAGEGCAEDLVGLFVAMCRAHEVPARMVWVDGHQYAEFYLADNTGEGHWFPCNVAGLRDFGSISDPRIILQKGDDIDVPEKSESQRYVAEHLSGSGNVKPAVRFIRLMLPN